MASVQITVDAKAVNRAINGVRTMMHQRKSVLDSIGKGLMEYTKETITTQGRGTWAPLAKTTRLATGRNKALLPIRDQIRYRSNVSASTATVYFSGRPVGWNLEMHATGFTSRSVKGPVMANRRLGVFSARKESVIPPRRVFPTTDEAAKIAGPLVDKWVEKIIRLNWHD